MTDPNTSPIEAACMTLQQLKEINLRLGHIEAMLREQRKPAIAADTPKRVSKEMFKDRKKVPK